MSSCSASDICVTYFDRTCTITTAHAHICPWARPYRGLFRSSDAFWRHQFSVDCTINIFGFDFRQGQGSPAKVYSVGSTSSHTHDRRDLDGEGRAGGDRRLPVREPVRARGRGCAIVIIDAACFSLGSWCMLSGGRQGEVAAPELLTIRPPCKAHSIGSAPK
jgi:hypothetical protein